MNTKILISILIAVALGILFAITNNTKETPKTPITMQNTDKEQTMEGLQTTLIAGGCFWCVESDLEKLPGVTEVISGYAGGTSENPTYENYIRGGHREVVEVHYDPEIVSLAEIAIFSIKHMDPTDGDGSFYDRGDAYAPALYYSNNEEKTLLESIVSDIETNGPYKKPLAIKVQESSKFWMAEEYHQDYYKGTLSSIKYQYYRKGSGRDAFIEENWGDDTGPSLSWNAETNAEVSTNNIGSNFWANYQKPSKEILKNELADIAYNVTQEEGTERAGTSPLDKEYGRGIYVDILSGEPLFSSLDKFDSGTGWPSFTKPITETSVTEHIDKKLFSTRTEIRSTVADNHIGHVFPDGPRDSTGLRYCMNGAALRFVPEAEMEAAGYSDYLKSI